MILLLLLCHEDVRETLVLAHLAPNVAGAATQDGLVKRSRPRGNTFLGLDVV
jgi:hypothetical protein